MNLIPPLTKEEEEHRRKMDEQVGDLMIEVAQFIDLPVGLFNRLPEWVKRMSGIKRIGRNTSESIGAAIREQFKWGVTI